MITSLYFITSLVVGIAFIVNDPEKIAFPLLTQLGILGVFSYFMIINLIANEYTADSVERRIVEISYVKEISYKLKAIVGSFESKEANRQIESLYDYIHASPVRSSPLVAEIENKISGEVDKLFTENKINDSVVIASAKTILRLAEERNRILKNI
jgi:hypothetical protein